LTACSNVPGATHEVAKALRAPLDVFFVRKLGTPGHREVAIRPQPIPEIRLERR
jgi:predicted phosphoribosyltransferase